MNELTMRLLGGDRIVVRPMTSGDAEAVRAAFERLSPNSLRHRFFTPVPRITTAIADDLTRLDDGRVVLVAIDASGAIVGEARAIRRRDEPTTAEIAVTIADALQHRRLGTKLLRRLQAEATRVGIDRFAGHVQVDNAAGQALLVSSGAACWLDEPGVIGFEIPLGRRTVAPEIAARQTLGRAS